MLKIIIVVLLIVFGVYAYNNSSSSPQPVMTETTTPADTPSPSRYLPFTDQDFATTASSRRVLFFYASWCPTCRPVDKLLSENSSKVPGDVVIFRVNYNDPETDDQEKELAKKYEITYQHTFVQVDEGGNVITKWNGGGLTELLENLI